MRALLFPGQGARGVLEAVRAWRAHPLLELARACTGLSWDVIEAEAGRALERTEVLQPLLTAVSLAVHESFATSEGSLPLPALAGRGAGVRGPTGRGSPSPGASRHPLPALQGEGNEVVLGHSLGEVAAACVAGAFEARTAVELAAQRGRLMAREAARHPGGLIAVSAREAVPSLELAAINAPDEFILGGLEEHLPRGHQRVPVSGAWHTSAMAGAVAEFRAALEAAAPRALSRPLVRNLDGEVTRDVGSLAEQLVRPVQFVASLQRLETLGVDTLVLLGPGLVLRGLVRRTLGTRMRVLTTEDPADLERTIAATRSAP